MLGKGSFDFRLYLWNSFVIAVVSSAIAIVLTIPAALFIFIAQKSLVKGMTAGSVKG